MGFPRLQYYEATSTLDIGREQARRGIPHGAVITASHQSVGRGRRGTAWLDEPGASALMTFVLRPQIGSSALWRIAFIASLACTRAIRALGFYNAQVKWPNDLVIEGKKYGGLLVEPAGVNTGAYLLGIGINVAQMEFPSGAGFALTPTSLRLAAVQNGMNLALNAEDVITAVSQELQTAWTVHLASGEALVQTWRACQMTGQMQKGVALDTGASVEGIFRDVRTEDGAALLEVAGSTDWVAALPAFA